MCQKVGCDPYSLLQGHALWHVLTGLSSFCSYAFFRFTGNGLKQPEKLSG